MTQQDPAARGPAPYLFGVLTLPVGVTQGYVSVSLAYVLSHHGVSVAAIAGLVSLMLLPQTLRFIAGPVVDMSLTSKGWVAIAIGVMAIGLGMMAFTSPTVAGMPLLGAISLALGVAGATQAAASSALIAQSVPVARRGAVAGWTQTGNLGGVGLGGGVGLWLTVHAGGLIVAALVLAAACAACAAPLLVLHAAPRPGGDVVSRQAASLGADLWSLLRTRQGVLAALVVTIPAALGAAANLFAAVAGDWRASADLVAGVTGVLGGLVTVPGCMIGGYLCDRFPRRIVYVWAAATCAAGEAAMAWAPHSPAWFAVMVLVNAVLLGVAFAAVSAVIYECLGPRAAATVAALLGSLCNVPVVAMTALVGWVQTRHGSSAMLLTEAGVGIVAVSLYAALAWAWRPQTRDGLGLVAARA